MYLTNNRLVFHQKLFENVYCLKVVIKKKPQKYKINVVVNSLKTKNS